MCRGRGGKSERLRARRGTYVKNICGNCANRKKRRDRQTLGDGAWLDARAGEPKPHWERPSRLASLTGDGCVRSRYAPWAGTRETTAKSSNDD